MFESCRDRQHPTRYKCNRNRRFQRGGLVGKAHDSLRDDSDFEADQRQIAALTSALPAIWTAAGAALSSLDVMPRRPSRLASRSVCGFLVVSSTSPMKMELAPATKHSACNSSVIYWRPADSRSTLFGIMIRATAIIRTSAIGSGRSAVSLTGTPLTSFHRLIGTLSG